MHVCSGVKKEIPLFKMTDDKAYLLTREVSTLYFDEHLNAFRVEERTSVYTMISVDGLVYYRPRDRQFAYQTDDHMYIVPYCDFV